MKKLFYLLILCNLFNLKVFSQETLESIDTLNYSKMIDKKNNQMFKNGMEVKVYISESGNSFKVGDTLVLGDPSGINKTRTFDGVTKRFEYVYYGTPAAILLKGMRYVEAKYSGYKLTISKMLYSKFRSFENYIFLYTKPIPEANFTIIDEFISVTLLDKAVRTGEISPLKATRKMTREEAIKYLKSKKDELDLELISKEEYEKIKLGLMPIIQAEAK